MTRAMSPAPPSAASTAALPAPRRAGFVAFLAGLVALVGAAYAATVLVEADYVFYAGFSVLQFLSLGIAWNILGGYGGYVNFGVAGFFGAGAYAAIALNKLAGGPPLVVLVVAGALAAAVLGGLAGAITLRLRGVYFAIATLALAVLLETAVTNWDYVGAARGAYLIPPPSVPGFASYIKFLFFAAAILAAVTVAAARAIERSRFGRALFALRDGEDAAEACGVPTLRVKIAAAAVSCGLMGATGALLPFYLTFLEPGTAFGMSYSISAVAVAMVGGIAGWLGPVVGALVLGIAHQATTVVFSSEIGILILGLVLMTCVAAAPDGLVGLGRRLLGGRRR